MDDYQRFLQTFHLKKFDKGELILVQGEVPDCALVVKKGVVKTYNLTAQGEEKPIAFDIKGEIFPIGWVFKKSRRAQYYYEAFTDVELYCVPPSEYLSYIQHDTARMFKVFDYFVTNYLGYQMRINALEQSKAAAKVLHTIHFLCIRFGVNIKENLVKVQVPLTQQDLANFMGLTRETTGIELKKLQRQGILTYKKQNYIVRTDKLSELLDEEYDVSQMDTDQVRIEL